MFNFKCLKKKPNYILIHNRGFPIWPRIVFAMFPKDSMTGFVHPDIFSLNALDNLTRTVIPKHYQPPKGCECRQPIILAYLFLIYLKKEKLYDSRKIIRLKRKIQFLFDILNIANIICRKGKYHIVS